MLDDTLTQIKIQINSV